jgi:ceramide glucosyltransferase
VFVLAILAILSAALNFWQWFAAVRFPLRRIRASLSLAPPITCLKPLKGCDSQTRSCLESWFKQQYSGSLQLFFGVASAHDPVCKIVQDLIAEFPGVPAKLIICEPLLGPNAKISTLCHLMKEVQHEHIIISDADVFIPPDFLQKLIVGFENSTIGLVNCFYELANPRNLAMKWEAIAVNADFWSQVLQGVSLKPMDFALGAVMATTRANLQKIGGFESLLHYLADDYQLGNRIAKSGATLRICPTPVECRSDPMSWREVWNHQLRWARTIRVCQPLPYFFSLLSNATLWPLLWVAVFPFSIASAFFPFAIALRMATAAHNYHRLVGRAEESNPFWLAPFKDLLQFVIWSLSFVGNKIQWRGETFRVAKGGKLVKRI